MQVTAGQRVCAESSSCHSSIMSCHSYGHLFCHYHHNCCCEFICPMPPVRPSSRAQLIPMACRLMQNLVSYPAIRPLQAHPRCCTEAPLHCWFLHHSHMAPHRLQDGDFSEKRFRNIVNAALANDIGNLLNRTLNLLKKNCGGAMPANSSDVPDASPVRQLAQQQVGFMSLTARP